MEFSNIKIYDLAIKAQSFYEDKNLYLPVKVGFYLYKNLEKITEAANSIEFMRSKILEAHNASTDENKEQKFQKEMNELKNLTQEINFHYISLEDFEDIKLNPEQFSVIINMIDDDEENEDDFEDICVKA